MMGEMVKFFEVCYGRKIIDGKRNRTGVKCKSEHGNGMGTAREDTASKDKS